MTDDPLTNLIMASTPSGDAFVESFLLAAAERPDTHLAIAAGASGIAHCRRQQSYTLARVPKTNTRTLPELGEGRMSAIMGNAVEPHVYEALGEKWGLGYEIEMAQVAWAVMSCGLKFYCPDDTELVRSIMWHQNEEQHDCVCLITGHPDGVINVENVGRVLLELKFMGARRFTDLSSAPCLKESDTGYYEQMEMNMHGLGVDKGVIMAFAKDSSAVKWNKRQWKFAGHPFMYVEVLDLDEATIEWGLNRAYEVVAHRAEPSKAPRDHQPEGSEADWQCRYCDHHGRCLEDGVKEETQ